ncbi:hypothetical protein EKO27_g9899 [Xylaria grammica]|uniref:Uncharacterized protein n=1 Tax=Xylaria grammica TaxID=363999 RepID=A0A439CSQ4_9PEZI|nr:hypothetical protein EKO27_g9899 [Xylaria grammica]
MGDFDVIGGNSPASRSQLETNDGFSNSRTEPRTPELGSKANQGRFGLPSPDATPEYINAPFNNHKVYGSAHADPQLDVHSQTPPPTPKGPLTNKTPEEQHHFSQDAIHIEVEEPASERPSASSIHVSSADQETSHPSLSITQRLLALSIRFINLATQRSSRASGAQVEDTIRLIRSVPSIRRTRVTNLRKKLTASQYGEVRKAIQSSEDAQLQAFFEDKLRFDYTRSKKLFEIRMPTAVHEFVGNGIAAAIVNWYTQLRASGDEKVARAASSVMDAGSTDVEFPFVKGESDSKSPDKSFMHTNCERQCEFPSVVVEIGFTQSRNDLIDKAESYIRRSKGEVRVVVGVALDKIYQAEKRNEARLKSIYMGARGPDEIKSYRYEEDEHNETGEGSIIIWRPEFGRRGTVTTMCVRNEIFRDNNGKSIDSPLLGLSLQDFICKKTKDSSTGNFVARPPELLAADLCKWIDEGLVRYRRKRNKKVKKDVENEKREQKRAEGQRNSKNKRGMSSPGDGSRTFTSEGPGTRARIAKGLGNILKGL